MSRRSINVGSQQSQTDAPGTDILRGADVIAGFLLGAPEERRIIYHLASTTDLPVFRLGSVLCARKSALVSWLAEQECKGSGKKVAGSGVKS